ncbi:MAG: hypothetical protein OEW37_01915 [Rhodospirillaceae bacterium]|nr:hypothetical protein [Rhodospirillaceae bacterium]
MNYEYTPSNNSQSIIYEAASPHINYYNETSGESIFEDGFFNLIALRSFMVLSITAIAANLRVILEGVL